MKNRKRVLNNSRRKIIKRKKEKVKLNTNKNKIFIRNYFEGSKKINLEIEIKGSKKEAVIKTNNIKKTSLKNGQIPCRATTEQD